MYVEKTPNGKYNLMQISDTVFNDLLALLNSAIVEDAPVNQEEAQHLERLMRTESELQTSKIEHHGI